MANWVKKLFEKSAFTQRISASTLTSVVEREGQRVGSERKLALIELMERKRKAKNGQLMRTYSAEGECLPLKEKKNHRHFKFLTRIKHFLLLRKRKD